MPLSRNEERFGSRLRQEVNAINRELKARGMSRKQRRTEINRLLKTDSPHQKALRAYGEHTLQLDWATILKLIVQLLPLLLMFI